MLSQEAIQKILGITDKVFLKPIDMAKELKVTFYPKSVNASKEVVDFSIKLRDSFSQLNVTVVPYDEIWEMVSIPHRLKRFFRYTLNDLVWIFRKVFNLSQRGFLIPLGSIIRLAGSMKIKKGVSIICLGEQTVEDLPMQHISNFKDNSVITLVDFPGGISEESQFHEHFNVSMAMFAHHMTNIVIAVDTTKWMLYNFNASHPIYKFSDDKFDDHILNGLIPKVVAPISPHRFVEFRQSERRFDLTEDTYVSVINELKIGAKIFGKTGLYPDGKRIDDLPFRHDFHRLIGKLHLDSRNGMSFGFLSFQLPTKLSIPVSFSDFVKIHSTANLSQDFFVDKNTGEIFIFIELDKRDFVFKVPDVWVMTLRSGSDKTNFIPSKDLLKLGLVNGEMWMEFPKDLKISHDYKPSFDTKVILAHAVGNAIVASIARFIDTSHKFPELLQNTGIAISHWHGYFNKNHLPKGVDLYGLENPHVSCSSPQSAIYALDGKLNAFWSKIGTPKFGDYRGDIHVEPHHGVNVNFPSLIELAQLILADPQSTALGNKYL